MKKELVETYYTNPLSKDDFPDPCIIEVESEGYYAYGTHDEFSPSTNNIQVKHSTDLVHWSKSQGALVAPPVWGQHCQRFWCPHVVYINNEFRLYYAAEPDTKDGMCLALAVSNRPVDFVDCGHPLSHISGSTFQMIDPFVFVDPLSNKHLLYYGSAHEPIRVVELSQDGKTFISNPKAVLYPGHGTFHRLREGAFVTYNQTWNRYFLWVSGSNTWEEKEYAVSVYWATDPTAVFETIPRSNLILQPNDVWDSPGHNCIIQDAIGDQWMLYHAVDTKDRFIPETDKFMRRMCMDRILYTDDGWPYIRNNSPSFLKQKGPVVVERA